MAIDLLRSRHWILLPGTLCTEAVFGPMLDCLKVPTAQRHGVTIDRAELSDYAALMQPIQGSIICGFSLGAIIAAHLADRLAASRIILFGLNPLADDPTKAGERHALARDVVTLGGSAALGRRLPPFGGRDPEATRSAVHAMADETATFIDAQTQLALSRPGALPALGRARCPVHCLTGNADVMAPPALGKMAAEAAPMGQFHVLDGLGHYALLEDPMACAESVRMMEASLDHAA